MADNTPSSAALTVHGLNLCKTCNRFVTFFFQNESPVAAYIFDAADK